MKPVEYFVCLAVGVVAVVLAVLVFTTARSAQNLQTTLNAQQEQWQSEVNKGSISQQIGASLLRDAAQIALTNAAMRDLLLRNGISVTLNPPAAAPAPARN